MILVRKYVNLKLKLKKNYNTKKEHYHTCKILRGNGNDLTNSNPLCNAMAMLITAQIDHLYKVEWVVALVI